MTTSNVIPAVNEVNDFTTTQFIEELSLIIAAQDLTPTMMSLDFLKFSGIIPKEWELSQQPVCNPNYAQLNFTNGLGITAQPRTVTISESLGSKSLEELSIATVANNYIAKLPHAEYVGFSISPKILIPFPNAPETARQFISGSLLGSGTWKNLGRVPVQAAISLMYVLERCQLTLNVSEARLQQPDKSAITAMLFAGNFSYSINTTGERLEQMQNCLNNWQSDLLEFREIVNQKFLDGSTTSSSSSVGETSLFPGQTL